jgi:hypothetical protein
MDTVSARHLEARQMEANYLCGSTGSTFEKLLYGKQAGDLRSMENYELDNGEAEYE